MVVRRKKPLQHTSPINKIIYQIFEFFKYILFLKIIFQFFIQNSK